MASEAPKNQPRSQRIPIACDVRIAHHSFGEKIVKTKNMSDTGLYLLTEPEEMPAVGELITGQVLGTAETTPVLAMKIVRTDSGGVGIQFVTDE